MRGYKLPTSSYKSGTNDELRATSNTIIQHISHTTQARSTNLVFHGTTRRLELTTSTRLSSPSRTIGSAGHVLLLAVMLKDGVLLRSNGPPRPPNLPRIVKMNIRQIISNGNIVRSVLWYNTCVRTGWWLLVHHSLLQSSDARDNGSHLNRPTAHLDKRCYRQKWCSDPNLYP